MVKIMRGVKRRRGGRKVQLTFNFNNFKNIHDRVKINGEAVRALFPRRAQKACRITMGLIVIFGNAVVTAPSVQLLCMYVDASPLVVCVRSSFFF